MISNFKLICVLILTLAFSGLTAQNVAPKLISQDQFSEEYSIENRKFAGIPSIAVSNKGRIWMVWYSGKTRGEDSNSYVLLSTSTSGGKTRKELLIIDPDGEGPCRAFDPEVWIDPKGKLWVFWAQSEPEGFDGSVSGVWAVTSNNANIENPSWSKPRRLTDGIMMCKPVVLSTGEWILPASTWFLNDNSAKAIVSTDEGLTWRERGSVNVPKDARAYDEHMIVEKMDGSLWMLVRTKYGIGESISTDKGVSWSPLTPSEIKHTSTRFFIRRLNSGNLLLVKHGPIDMQTGRSHLMAFISKDDGQSWSRGLLLDERRGVSYPDGQQIQDGTIYIIYDYNRTKEQMILMTSFTEEDVLRDDHDAAIVEVFNRRMLINQDGGKEKP